VNGSPASVPVSAEGATTVTYFATDLAGNSCLPQAITVKVDRTPPTITASTSPRGAKITKKNKTLPVKVSGAMTETVSGVNTTNGAYSVADSNGAAIPGGNFTDDGQGNFSSRLTCPPRS